MPISADLRQRLYPNLPNIAGHFGTPFHIYDEAGIRATGQALNAAFAKVVGGFREYYAVKALPNPQILKIMQDLGFGFDCSSLAELELVRSIGARGDDIMFTSNNTSSEEFAAALGDGGCILNLDDINLIDKVPTLPEQGFPELVDRKSTRLNSSHVRISYAVFCLKKKKTENKKAQHKNT